MRLVDLEVDHYRSIRGQSGERSIEFAGLDCLVGENNAGKTNILSAVKFLLGEQEKNLDDELFWQKKTDNTVDIRGFFEVEEEDLNQIDDSEKQGKIEDSLLDPGLLRENGYERLAQDHNQILGICRRVDGESFSPHARLLDFRTEDDRLSIEHLEQYRDSRWNDQKEDDKGYSKDDYERDMREEFPEVADLIDSKHQQKGVWKTKLEEFIQSRPDSINFDLQPTDFKQGTKTLILNNFLPQVISIPAVREVESATQRGGEFGNLIDHIRDEIQEELDKQFQEEVGDFHPRDHESIRRVEGRISRHLNSAFEEQSVQIDLPEFSTKYLFKNADIRIEEDYIEDLSKENVGEGVKRTVIFSLLHTLMDIRSGRFTLTEDSEPVENPRSLLILYEEAELFLHPSLQKKLLDTLSELSRSDAQVILSTHSPVMIQGEILDTINIVRKGEENGTTVTQFHGVLQERSDADQSRLTDLKSVSSYIFAEKVVLVEGLSDKIVFQKMTSCLNSDWNFARHGVPVINAGGKGDICRFKRFLEDLGIETHIIFDIDAAKGECQTVVSSEPALEKLQELEDTVMETFSGPRYSGDDLNIKFRTMPWEDAFNKIEDLKERIKSGEETNEDDAELLTKLLAKGEISTPPNRLWASEEVEDERVAVVEKLLEENILLLSGELEDYYPYDGGNKRDAALSFDPSEYKPSELRSQFQSLNSYGDNDVETFFKQVFN